MKTIQTPAFRRLFELEDDHWWFDGMETITRRLLDGLVTPGLLPPRARTRALDAGCGTGRNLGLLERRYAATVVGVDLSAYALGCCARRGGAWRLVRGSVNRLPFAADSFELVTCLDVFITAGVDDRLALAEFARVLRPGGWVLLRMAAYDWLRGGHDEEWAIAHRYHRPELLGKLVAAGLEPVRASYANAWLLPLAVLRRLSDRLRPRPAEGAEPASGDLAVGTGTGPAAVLGRGFRRILASEAGWVAGPPLPPSGLPAGARVSGGPPCGLSLVALARKPTAGPAAA